MNSSGGNQLGESLAQYDTRTHRLSSLNEDYIGIEASNGGTSQGTGAFYHVSEAEIDPADLTGTLLNSPDEGWSNARRSSLV